VSKFSFCSYQWNFQTACFNLTPISISTIPEETACACTVIAALSGRHLSWVQRSTPGQKKWQILEIKTIVQCVPLATEPGILLIVLPLMRILQRNLKRTYTYTNTQEQEPYCVGTLSQMTERSAERRIRQETGWLAGGPLLRVATIRRTTDTHYRHIPLRFSHNERTLVQISLQYLHWC
jgi:hypothetical protein